MSTEEYPFEYTRTLGEVSTLSGKFTYEIQTAKKSTFTNFKSQTFYDKNNKTEFEIYGHTAPVVGIESATYSDNSATIKCASFEPKIAEARYGETTITYKFNYVLVYKLDRFARNRYDSAMYKNMLKKHNIKVISIKENISDSPEGIILESVLEGMAEYYSANLSQNIKRGMTENALQCKFNGSGCPLGFKITPDKHYEIDEPLGHIDAKEIIETIDELMKNFKALADLDKKLSVKKAPVKKEGTLEDFIKQMGW